MKKTKIIFLSLLSCTLLFSSCRKEEITIWTDKGCIYEGDLEVQRTQRDEFRLVTIMRGAEPKVTQWAPTDQRKRALMGDHIAVYAPSDVMGRVEQIYQLMLPSTDGFARAYGAPIVFGVDEGTVEFEELTTLTPLERHHSKGVLVSLSNSTQRTLSDVDITVSSGATAYNLLIGKPAEYKPFKLHDHPFVVSPTSLHESKGYMFGLTSSISLSLTFRDDEGVLYAIDKDDAFTPSLEDQNLYIAQVDLSEEGLDALGAKKTVNSIRIDGSDVVLPPKGGTLTLDVHAFEVTNTFQRGKLIDSKEEEISYSFTTEGSDEITIAKVDADTFEIKVTPNLTQSSRTKTINITAGGVTRTISLTQAAVGFDVSGEIS